MIGEHKLRKARKSYDCTEQSYHKIDAGDTYLFSSVPPWHEMARAKKWCVMRACLRCAKVYGLLDSGMRKQLGVDK